MTAPQPSSRLWIFGEVLIDEFPDGRRVLGGAPFNVAWHLRAFGLAPCLVSRVGDDEAGRSIRRAMEGWAMDTGGLQTDRELPTGRVAVRIEGGEPAYEIVHPSAWDAIEPPRPMSAGSLLYHGSLALRDGRSRAALEQLRASARATARSMVFLDVNLRPPWWSGEAVAADVAEADWVKLNEIELAQLGFAAGEVKARAAAFRARYELNGLVLTRGAAGAILLTPDGCIEAAFEGRVEVMDTVGAGDAFSAVMILGLARGWPLGITLERALDFAAAICGQRGATAADRAFYAPFIDRWQLMEEAPLNV